MEDKKLKLLLGLISIVSILTVYLSSKDLMLLLSPLSVKATYKLEFNSRIRLEETYNYQIKRNYKYRMLYRFWEEPLSFQERLNRPFLLLEDASGFPFWYAKDYKGFIEGKFPPSALPLIRKLAQRNELGLVKPSYFKKGEYKLTASYLIFPPVEFLKNLSHVNLKLADFHAPYKEVLIFIYDPESRVKEIYPHFPYYQIKRLGDGFLIDGYSPENSILGVELLLKGKVDGFLHECPDLTFRVKSANLFSHFAHKLWIFLLWFGRVVLISLPLVLLYIYYNFGKEKKFVVPSFLSFVPNPDRPPWFVNLVFTGDAFEGDENAFFATLLDFYRRGIIDIEGDKIILKGGSLKDPYEKKVYFILRRLSKEEGGNLVFKPEYVEELKNKEPERLKFLKGEINLLLNYKNPVVSVQFVDDRGARVVKGLLSVSFSITFFLFIVFSFEKRVFFYTFDIYPFVVLFSGFTFALFLVSLLPTQFFGRWKENYYLERLQWEAFKNFLSDLAAIKKYAPQDISIWKEWLVYGTALGVADKVIEAMRELKVELPEVQKIDALRGQFKVSYSILNSLASDLSSVSSASGGSFGGGGGFGGGGAGGR